MSWLISDQQRTRTIRLMLAMMLVLSLVAACGGDDDSDDEAGGATGNVPTATTGSSEAENTPTEAGSDEDDATPTSEGAASPDASPATGGMSIDDIDLSGVDIRWTGAQPTALNMVTQYMMDLMEEWGAEIDAIELTSTTGVQALIAGQTDLAGGGSDELVLGAAAGADIIAVASTQDKMDYVLVATKDITSIEQLKDKTIGMSGPAGYDTLLSRLAVKRNGLELDDVNFVQIGGSGDRSAALAAGRVDAATIFISDWYELERRTSDLVALAFMNELVNSSTKSMINTTTEYAADNPEIMFALACANLESYEWFHADKQAFIDYTLEHVEGSTEEATSQLYDQLIEIDMYPLDVDDLLEAEGVQEVADIMLENGDIDNQVDASEFVDRSYLEQAAASGCGQQ